MTSAQPFPFHGLLHCFYLHVCIYLLLRLRQGRCYSMSLMVQVTTAQRSVSVHCHLHTIKVILVQSFLLIAVSCPILLLSITWFIELRAQNQGEVVTFLRGSVFACRNRFDRFCSEECHTFEFVRKRYHIIRIKPQRKSQRVGMNVLRDGFTLPFNGSTYCVLMI